jgi:RNA polymerase primary sigma factor
VDPKSQDPVHLPPRYTPSAAAHREGEAVIAKRIERGQLVVVKATTRSPIVEEIIAVGEGLRKGMRSIKEIVQLDNKSSPKKNCQQD